MLAIWHKCEAFITFCCSGSIAAFFFLRRRRPPRPTRVRSSAASDVYKRQVRPRRELLLRLHAVGQRHRAGEPLQPVSYTHLRAHETPEHLVCRLLLEKK